MTAPLLPEYVPPDTDLFMERSNLIGLILSGVAYGILFTIFVQCAMLLTQGSPRGRSKGSSMSARERVGTWLMYYAVAMSVLATIAFGANTKFIQMTYIDYRSYPGGPNAFTQTFYNHPINLTSFVCYTLMTWLGDGLVLYRFLIIYNFKKWLLVFPCLVYLAMMAMSICLVVSINAPGGDFWTTASLNFAIAFWSLSIGLNLGLTLLIAGRLFLMRNRVRRALGPEHSTAYTSILSMLIESAALYSTCGLVFIILYARNSPVQNIVLPPLGQIQGIAPLLIIFRVGSGKAWSRREVAATSANPTSGIVIGGGVRMTTTTTTNTTATNTTHTGVGSIALTQFSTKVHDHGSTEWPISSIGKSQSQTSLNPSDTA